MFIAWYIILILSIVNKILCYHVDMKKDVSDCLPDCDSEIYCRGELLHDVQISRIFNDGTTFVQKRLLYPEKQIVEKYKKLKKDTGRTPSSEQLLKFVNENFANDSLISVDFPDFNPNPSILNKIKSEKYKKWLIWLNNRWLELGGRLHDDIKINPDLHSYLYIPNAFIKAGGRFTETYYWDSYWIVRGLLLCDMHDTARGIIENILYLVNQYGHMPNGNRKFYLQRSQPPMLIQMAAFYYEHTKNSTFIKTNLPTFAKEFQFWNEHRSVKFEKGSKLYKMFRYKSLSCDPRPESYYKDYDLVKNLSSPELRMHVFTGIRSAAESGWDFSSRHMRNPQNSIHDKTERSLLDMDPMNMIYVDLNSIIYSNLIYLSEWHKMFEYFEKATKYEKQANDLLEAIEEVLWNEKIGIWLDYDLITEKSRNYFYGSNMVPLAVNAYKKKEYISRVINYFETQEIINEDMTFKYYCVPSSMINTTEQWDYPNCWAPLEGFIIAGFQKTDDPNAKSLAFNLVQQWIKTTYAGFHNASDMFEKYNAIVLGKSGSGGEYAPQTGFGWTNGLVIDILDRWGYKLD